MYGEAYLHYTSTFGQNINLMMKENTSVQHLNQLRIDLLLYNLIRQVFGFLSADPLSG